MNDIISNRINNIKNGATKSQRVLIEYIEQAKYTDLMYLSITELACLTGVGEATILRFCRALGFAGYQDFRLGMAKEVSADGEPQSSEGYVSLVRDNITSAFMQSEQFLQQENIDAAIKMLLSSKNISIFGIGNSYVPALELHNRLIKMGILTSCESDSHMQNILVSTMSEQDCVVLFSISGGTKDIIEVAEIAKESGAKVIVVTSYDKSPLTKYADCVLLAIRRESPIDGGSMISKMIQLYVVDIISTGIFLSNKEKYEAIIKKSSGAVVKKLV